MTYDELLTRLAKTLVNDPLDSDLLAMVPRFIEDAENRVYREVDWLALRTTATLPVAIGDNSYSVPADCLAVRALRLIKGTTTTVLLRRDDAYLDAYWPDTSFFDTPKYWSMPDAFTIRIAPPPLLPFPIQVTYSARPARLSADVPSTWLSTSYGDLLFAAVMVAAMGYQRDYGATSDDPKQALSWEGVYQAALASAQTEEGRRRLASTSVAAP
jgi:hypothetical protein